MNFFNENDDEKKAGAPVTPSISSPFKKTSAFGKGPMFSRTAGGIMDRLKNLSRKDMAFVGIGLSVLVMVPVAEYMMSQPSKDNLLEGGFGTRDAAGAGAGSGLYEPGINALSQGSPDGSGEVITPLSSRDPASLILGAQPAQPAVALTPPQSAPVENYRDSMKEAARNSFSAAAANTGAPTPIPRMNGALRMAGSFFGDGSTSRTSGQLGGGKIIEDAKSASAKSAKRSMVGPVAVAGYKGVASSTPNSASKGAFEKLRAAADKAAGNFSGDSAIRSLDKAAADSVEIGKGGGGLGAGQDSEKVKNATNSNNSDRHSQSGESLAQMAAKTRMQKALEWEMYKKYEIKKQLVGAVVSSVGTVLGKVIEKYVGGAFGLGGGGAGPSYVCLTKADPSKDCNNNENAIYKNTVVMIESSDTKDFDTWLKYGTSQCPCLAMSKSSYDKIMAQYGGTGGAAATTVANPVTTQQVSAVFKDFDTQLLAVLANVRDADSLGKESSPNAEKMHKYNKAAADGVALLMAGSKYLPAILDGVDKSVETFNGSINTLNATVTEANTAVSAAEADVKAVDEKITWTLANRETAEYFKVKDEKLKADLSDNSAAVKNLKEMQGKVKASAGTLAAIRPDITMIMKSVSFYRNQSVLVSTKVNALRKNGGILASKAQNLSAGMGDDAKKATAPAMREALAKLWGTPAGDTIVGSVVLARGIQPETVTKDPNLNDEPANKTEISNWSAVSPKLAISKPEAFTGQQGSMEDHMVAATRRGNFELAEDISFITQTASGHKKAADSISKMMADFKAELKITPANAGGKTDLPVAATGDGKPNADTAAASTTPVLTKEQVETMARDAVRNPWKMTPAQVKEAEVAADTIADCSNATGGFSAKMQRDCSVQESDRVAGMGKQLDPLLSPEKALRGYKTNAGIACDFVRLCQKRNANITLPAGCNDTVTSGLR